jgi:hypothetical protein
MNWTSFKRSSVLKDHFFFVPKMTFWYRFDCSFKFLMISLSSIMMLAKEIINWSVYYQQTFSLPKLPSVDLTEINTFTNSNTNLYSIFFITYKNSNRLSLLFCNHHSDYCFFRFIVRIYLFFYCFLPKIKSRSLKCLISCYQIHILPRKPKPWSKYKRILLLCKYFIKYKIILKWMKITEQFYFQELFHIFYFLLTRLN